MSFFFFLIDSIVSLVVSLVTLIGGCMAADTIVGTVFIVPIAKPQQQQLEPGIVNGVLHPQSQQQGVGSNSGSNSNAVISQRQQHQAVLEAQHIDSLMNRRRVQLCKYFAAVTVVALGSALAAWDRWPMLWAIRVYILLVSTCGLVKGPALAVQEDYLRIPLTIAPWILATDFLVLS